MNNQSFFYRNGLTLTLCVFFVVSLCGQILTGLHEYNAEREDYGAPSLRLSSYLTTGHFYQTTFENWESEFLQMASYVLLTISLRQAGSSESKSLTDAEDVDREPDPGRPNAPGPVKRGGFALKVYRNSLSLAFVTLFLSSFIIHALGSNKNFNEEQILKGKEPETFIHFMGGSRFWFESFQNWQSEFVAVISIVVLSIFLRQHGSPESKPVDAAHSETGSG